MISIHDFSIAFGDFSLEIEDISLPEKGLVLLNGDNGSGKTSFLKAIAGFEHSYCGEICYSGKEIRAFSQVQRTTFISYLPQQSVLLPQITGREFLEEGLYLGGENRLEELIETLSVGHLLDRDCNRLSGGEKQILCFIRNLAVKKPVILLDEPEAFLSRSKRTILAETVSILDGLIVIASHHGELYSPNLVLNITEYEDYRFLAKKQIL